MTTPLSTLFNLYHLLKALSADTVASWLNDFAQGCWRGTIRCVTMVTMVMMVVMELIMITSECLMPTLRWMRGVEVCLMGVG